MTERPGKSSAARDAGADRPALLQTADGTRQLLQWGSSTLAVGLLSALLLLTVLGGVSPTGAHTNSGWFALIVALMCIPFGGLLTLLAAAKWLRNRSLRRRG
jgi:hypothetical protein